MDSYTLPKQDAAQQAFGAPTSTAITKDASLALDKKPDYQPDLFSPKAALPAAKVGQHDDFVAGTAKFPPSAPPAADFIAADFKPLAATAAKPADFPESHITSTAPAVPVAAGALEGDFATAPLPGVPSLDEVLARTGGADSRPASLMAVQHDQAAALPLPAAGGSGARSPVFSAARKFDALESNQGFKPAAEQPGTTTTTTTTTTHTVKREETFKPGAAAAGGAGSTLAAKASEAKEAASEAASTIKAKAADAVDRITEGRPVSEVASDVAHKVAGTGPYAGTAGVDTDTLHKVRKGPARARTTADCAHPPTPPPTHPLRVRWAPW
jgi:hypothetical protein